MSYEDDELHALRVRVATLEAKVSDLEAFRRLVMDRLFSGAPVSQDHGGIVGSSVVVRVGKFP